MNAPRHVRIFKNGRSRAIRIPKDLDTFADEVVLRVEGDRLFIERPDKKRDLREVIDWLRTQPRLPDEDDFPEIDDPLPEPIDLFGDDDDS